MIKSKRDLKYYLESDMKARYGLDYKVKPSLKKKVKAVLIPQPWYFQVLLRRAEYYTNCGSQLSRKVMGNFMKFRAYRYGVKCGYTVPINVFGPGLVLGHTGTIVVNGNVKVGSNARLQAGINIGAFSKFNENWQENAAPVLGDNIYIGPGAKIWGPIYIGNNVAIGANAIVNKTIPERCTVINANHVLVGKGSIDMVRYGDESKMPEDSYQFQKN